MVADDPPEMHVARKQSLQTLVVALEREFQLVHLLFENLGRFGVTASIIIV